MKEEMCYTIIVRGQIEPRRAHWFDGLTLTPLPTGETVMAGKVKDPAALHAILSRIRDLNLPLLLVRFEQTGGTQS